MAITRKDREALNWRMLETSVAHQAAKLRQQQAGEEVSETDTRVRLPSQVAPMTQEIFRLIDIKASRADLSYIPVGFFAMPLTEQGQLMLDLQRGKLINAADAEVLAQERSVAIWDLGTVMAMMATSKENLIAFVDNLSRLQAAKEME